MSPEKDIIAMTGLLGFLGTIFGFVYRGQNRQIAGIREDVKTCSKNSVSDKTSLERFKHVTNRMDDFKEDISKLYGVSTEHGKSLASIDTKLDLIIENSKQRRKGD